MSLLATHPQIAGVDRESHLFDKGVDTLFDNFERRDGRVSGLRAFVDHDELVDLARDLCDGVLLAMRAKLAPEAEFVVEKTPAGVRSDGLDLALKRECYPDASYVHIVRDREAVVRSLQKAPWQRDRSYDTCAAYWEKTVGAIRRTFGDLERYCEISFESLQDDPGEALRPLFDRLGIDSSQRVLDTVRALSQERFSELGAVTAYSEGTLKHRLKAHVKATIERARPGPPAAESPPRAFHFAGALRDRDADALLALTKPNLEFVLRQPGGDVHLHGDEARDALVRMAKAAFARPFVSEWWVSAGGGPGEWWTAAADKPVFTILFSGVTSDATRIDMSLGLFVEQDVVHRALVTAAGPLTGRPITSTAEL